MTEQVMSVEEIKEIKSSRRYVRTPLILSLIGLILSVVYGLGGIFSIISLILSAVRIKKKKSETLKWAMTISIVSLILSVLFLAAIFAVLLFSGGKIQKL